MAQSLLRYETVTGDDIKRLIDGASIESLRPTPAHGKPPTPSPYAPGTGTTVMPKNLPGDLPGKAGLSPA